MMTFDSLLKNTWRVGNARKNITATDIAASIDTLSYELMEAVCWHEVDCSRLFVFLIRNNLEGMRSYFIASRLKLRAILLNVRDVGLLSGVINPEHVAAIVQQDNTRMHFMGEITQIQLEVLSVTQNRLHADSEQARITNLSEAHFYFMTSGTTSTPKLVQYRESVLIENASAVVRYLELEPADNTLCFFPVQYMYGLSSMLCALLSNSSIIFENIQLSLVADLIERHNITTLPLIGDFMTPLSRMLRGKGCRIKRILNASDRLLTGQASAILPCCEILWNNFGQTESGPRLFCLRIRSEGDIAKYSRYGVVAPGFPMTPDIQIELRQAGTGSDSYEMFYQSPYAADGYVNRDLILTQNNTWQRSGDLFEQGKDNCYYWIARAANEFKFKGHFVPVQLISDQIMNETGVRHYFSRGESGAINVNVEESAGEEVLNTIRQMLADNWHHYPCTLNTVSAFPLTPSGKIRLISGI